MTGPRVVIIGAGIVGASLADELSARGWDQSDRFHEAWALLAAHYHAEVHVLAKVIPFTPPRPPRPSRGAG